MLREYPSAHGPSRRTEPVSCPARPCPHAHRHPTPRLGLTHSQPGSKGRWSGRGGRRDVISSTLTRLTARVTSASPPGRRSRPYASPLRRHHPPPPPSPPSPPTSTDLTCAATHTFLTLPPTLLTLVQTHTSSYYRIFYFSPNN